MRKTFPLALSAWAERFPETLSKLPVLFKKIPCSLAQGIWLQLIEQAAVSLGEAVTGRGDLANFPVNFPD
jgi:hypothetical protein